MCIDKAALLQILAQNKEKMSTDQFWCVALLSGYFGTLILKRTYILSFASGILIILLSLILAIWGTLYLVERHKTYIALQMKVADLVRGITDVPDGWHNVPGYFGKTFIMGYGAYCIIIWLLFAFVIRLYI